MSQRNSAIPDRRAGKPAGKSNTFFGGAAILAFGILVVKGIGMFYKVALTDLLGSQGMADFTNAYNIYSVLLTISTAGLPVAVSKLVSEANALGRHNQVNRVFRISLSVFLILGFLSFLVMHFASGALAGLMNDDMAAPGIKALAPAVICVGCLAAFRGYSQGHQNMTPTAVSQIIEAVVKLFLGLFLARYVLSLTFTVADMLRYRPELKEKIVDYTAKQIADALAATQTSQAAAAAITGVTVGTILALVYMIFTFTMGRAQNRVRGTDTPQDSGEILSTLLKIAVPITLTASMVGIVTVIDSSLVQGQLQRVLLENPDSWAGYSASIDFTALTDALAAWTQTLSGDVGATMATLNAQMDLPSADIPAEAAALHSALQDISRNLYGHYAGALNIYNLPQSLMPAITASVIPAVSAALARRDKKGSAKLVGATMRMSTLLSFPMGVGLFVLGEPIIALLFPSYDASISGPLLSALGIASVSVCMMLVCNSILQAHGFVTLPVILMVVGGAIKIAANYILVGTPDINIKGAPAGNILCFTFCFAAGLVLIARVIPERPRYLPILAKPAIASAAMGVGAWAVYGLSSKLLLGMARFAVMTDGGYALSRAGTGICVFLSIGVAVVIYAVLVVTFGGISRDDLSLMPKGDKIAKILRVK